MSAPDVTVIIPTFNRARYIAEALESVLNQTKPPSQVIVVNDGSSDDTEDVLASYKRRVDYLRQENAGKPTALNNAMSIARGKYIWVMDDDDVALPDALERHLAVLEARREVGFTYSACYLSSTGTDGRIVRGEISPYYLAGIPEKEFFARLLDTCFLNHPGIVVRKACLNAVGPFDTDLIRSEDYDIMLRLARRYPAAEITGPTYHQRQHAGCRGTYTQPIDQDHRWASEYEFDRKVFAKLYRDLDLREYLPMDERCHDFDHRAALIKRMSVLGRRGLWEPMIADLEELTSSFTDRGTLTERERENCRGAVGASMVAAKALVFDPTALARIIAACGGPFGREIRFNMAIGLYYWLPAWRKNENWASSSQLLWSVARLIGWSGFASTLRYHLERFERKLNRGIPKGLAP